MRRDLFGLNGMKLTILKNNEKTVCKQQDKECNGINCKTCQFNKSGIDSDRLVFLLRKLYSDILEKNKDSSIYITSNELALRTLDFLLSEEHHQGWVSEITFDKREIE